VQELNITNSQMNMNLSSESERELLFPYFTILSPVRTLHISTLTGFADIFDIGMVEHVE